MKENQIANRRLQSTLIKYIQHRISIEACYDHTFTGLCNKGEKNTNLTPITKKE